MTIATPKQCTLAPQLAHAAKDASRWPAVVTRDAAYENAFVYAVKTTGIYCRCSCASRTPLRANVSFFETPAQAEQAGFRACKRCRPQALPPSAQTAEIIARACRTIEDGEKSPNLTAIARIAHLSPAHFHRLFKAVTGVTPKDYWLAYCASKVRGALGAASSVTQAVHDAGFHSTRQFYEKSNEVLGMTPKAYSAGGASALIHFAVGQCSLGAILVAATQKGICAVLLGDDPETLVKELQDRFPAAELAGGDKKFEAMAAQVIAFAEHPDSRFNLPLDIRGTAFQHRVWKALRDIRPGKTASYTQIADKIGSPAAVRAVAGACAANPVAIIVPCHRVVRNDGALSGYRWGVERKRALLDRERAPVLKNKSGRSRADEK